MTTMRQLPRRLRCASMTLPRLYDELAEYWPLLSPPADHADEAAWIDRVLQDRLGPASSSARPCILELGSGAGHTLTHLVDRYEIVATDISPPMLAQSRKINPTVEHHTADMCTFRLDRQFDAVLATESIDYIKTQSNLRSVFTTAAIHLRPGGLFLVAPTYTRETYVNHQAEHDHRMDSQAEVTFVSYVRHEPTSTTFELIMLLLIKEHGRMRIEQDRHTCGLFAQSTWHRLLAEAGFDVEKHAHESNEGDPLPSDMFVAMKRR